MKESQIVEAILFASDAPLKPEEIARADESLDEDIVEEALRYLRTLYDESERAFEIVELGEGFQILTRPEFAPYLDRFDTVPRPSRLSHPALETLAILAYRQPIGRIEVEYIRGVSSAGVIRTLQDRGLIEVVGRDEGLGRPLLYGTTQRFLEHFGFASLEDLPRPDELPVILRERGAVLDAEPDEMDEMDGEGPETEAVPEGSAEPAPEVEPTTESMVQPDSELDPLFDESPADSAAEDHSIEEPSEAPSDASADAAEGWSEEVTASEDVSESPAEPTEGAREPSGRSSNWVSAAVMGSVLEPKAQEEQPSESAGPFGEAPSDSLAGGLERELEQAESEHPDPASEPEDPESSSSEPFPAWDDPFAGPTEGAEAESTDVESVGAEPTGAVEDHSVEPPADAQETPTPDRIPDPPARPSELAGHPFDEEGWGSESPESDAPAQAESASDEPGTAESTSAEDPTPELASDWVDESETSSPAGTDEGDTGIGSDLLDPGSDFLDRDTVPSEPTESGPHPFGGAPDRAQTPGSHPFPSEAPSDDSDPSDSGRHPFDS